MPWLCDSWNTRNPMAYPRPLATPPHLAGNGASRMLSRRSHRAALKQCFVQKQSFIFGKGMSGNESILVREK
jgi:hypothetical protein